MKKERDISFLSFAWTNLTVIALVGLFVCLYAVFECALPYSMSFIIDDGLMKSRMSVLNIAFIILAVSGIIIMLLQVLRDYLYLGFCSSFLKHIRLRAFSHLQNLSMCFYSKTAPGEILAKFSSDLASIENALWKAPAGFVIPIISAMITLVLLFIISTPLACISLLIFPGFFLGPYFLAPKAFKAGQMRKESEESAISDVQTTISAQPVVKAFGLQKISISFFEKSNLRLKHDMFKNLFWGSMVERSSITAALLLQALLLGIGAYLTFFGYLGIGEFVAFQALFLGLTYNLVYCSMYIPLIIQAKVGLSRINLLMNEVPTVNDMPEAKDISLFKNEIRFNNVSFGYTKNKTNLSELNLAIPKDTSVAFVGESGCGKSTILNLLMRFYDSDKGTISIDGQDIKSITQDSLRKQMGIVLQDSILFNTTIMSNIRAGKLNATDEEVYEAAKKAEIHNFIMSLPNGYETLAGERGGKLSGGQRQRIAIARALLHGGNILILDEATSALDPVTQASINKTIWKLEEMGITIISVTHHLASVTKLDKIFVMDKGKIIEQGTHDDLLAKNGLYRQMWNKQASEKE